MAEATIFAESARSNVKKALEKASIRCEEKAPDEMVVHIESNDELETVKHIFIRNRAAWKAASNRQIRPGRKSGRRKHTLGFPLKITQLEVLNRRAEAGKSRQ